MTDEELEREALGVAARPCCRSRDGYRRLFHQHVLGRTGAAISTSAAPSERPLRGVLRRRILRLSGAVAVAPRGTTRGRAGVGTKRRARDPIVLANCRSRDVASLDVVVTPV
ncbi:hypothetical protein GCM10009744_04200 [Kribbella alba]|uniref:Uncharacterized protein n=1 Tax=Kribbella alba TaxID=190197 RepID=A0ABP4QU58_9ACTN